MLVIHTIIMLQVFFLMCFGCGSGGCLGLESKAFGKRRIAKINFAEAGFLILPGSIFHDFRMPLAGISMIFVVLETCLELDNF